MPGALDAITQQAGRGLSELLNAAIHGFGKAAGGIVSGISDALDGAVGMVGGSGAISNSVGSIVAEKGDGNPRAQAPVIERVQAKACSFDFDPSDLGNLSCSLPKAAGRSGAGVMI